MTEWQPYVTDYEPITVGSIDGTDKEPHDHGIVRALQSTYRPNKGVQGNPGHTIFVTRLNHATTDETLYKTFSRYGDIKSSRHVRDIVTGYSKGYAFVEYYEEVDAFKAHKEAQGLVIDDKEIFVDFENERTMKGWIPRRLGGGLGGKKESGQLRFGGRDRPFIKPIIVQSKSHRDSEKVSNRDDTRSDNRYYGRRENRGQNRYDSHDSRDKNREWTKPIRSRDPSYESESHKRRKY